MKKTIIVNGTFVLLILFAIGCNNEPPAVQPQPKTVAEKELSQEELLSRGKYMVNAMGCNHCHTPKKMGPHGPEMDLSKMLSGYQAGMPLPPVDKKALQPGNWVLFSGDQTATIGPWGITYAANLTPDSTTGIGMWTEEVFVKTLRTGKHLGLEGGRPIMPPMPWETFASITDEDIKALYTYLRAIPAIKNKVPEYVSPPEVAKLK